MTTASVLAVMGDIPPAYWIAPVGAIVALIAISAVGSSVSTNFSEIADTL